MNHFHQNLIEEPNREAVAADSVVELTKQEQLFVVEYLNCWNVRKAGLRLGWSASTARVYGYNMMRRPQVQQAIAQFMEARAISAGVVLDQLAEIATSDFSDFLVYDPNTGKVRIDLAKAYKEGSTHLIKKVRVTKGSIEIELHDKVAVLGLLAKHFGMLVDKVEVQDWRAEASNNGANPEELRAQVKDVIRKLISTGVGPTDSGSAPGS